jgi:branched-chain amino acid transport system ATP-binding protein
MTPAPAPLLELREVHAGYGGITALRGVSLQVQSGEIVALIGANGAGKTTTLMCISGIVPSRQGSIRFQGRAIETLSAHRIVASGLAHVPEGRKIFAQLTVQENLLLGAYTRVDQRAVAADFERILTLFPILQERRHQRGGTLSGGEQQMLAIARALMAKPTLLLMDEPSMGVAPLLVARIFAAITELNREGLSILLVEQNAQLALTTASRCYVLETGSVVLDGDSTQLLAHPRVRSAYLGEAAL